MLIPTQVELADLILTYAIYGGREGTAMASAERDSLEYLYCQEAADAIRELLSQQIEAPARGDLADLILIHAMYQGRPGVELDAWGRKGTDYRDCLIASDAIGALLRGEDPHER